MAIPKHFRHMLDDGSTRRWTQAEYDAYLREQRIKMTVPGIPESFWDAEMAIFEAMLLKLMLDAARKGAENALPAGMGVGINWALVNKKVAAWAAKYTAELVKGITATTRTATQAAISAWIESGNPLDDLFTALAPIFGADRAEVIAVTEVTRAYAEGNRRMWKETGADGMTWMTAQDELVCPICGDLAAQSVAIDSEFASGEFTGIPPAHVNCRCYMQPKIALPGGG